MQNAPAVVTDGALQKSLLGMSFLNQFGTIRIEDGMLILNK
jgi:predicted aspartyl protease